MSFKKTGSTIFVRFVGNCWNGKGTGQGTKSKNENKSKWISAIIFHNCHEKDHVLSLPFNPLITRSSYENIHFPLLAPFYDLHGMKKKRKPGAWISRETDHVQYTCVVQYFSVRIPFQRQQQQFVHLKWTTTKTKNYKNMRWVRRRVSSSSSQFVTRYKKVKFRIEPEEMEMSRALLSSQVIIFSHWIIAYTEEIREIEGEIPCHLHF